MKLALNAGRHRLITKSRSRPSAMNRKKINLVMEQRKTRAAQVRQTVLFRLTSAQFGNVGLTSIRRQPSETYGDKLVFDRFSQ